jgi:hypothetical protein
MDVHSYKDADIARVLGISRGAIAMRLLRSRSRLKVERSVGLPGPRVAPEARRPSRSPRVLRGSPDFIVVAVGIEELDPGQHIRSLQEDDLHGGRLFLPFFQTFGLSATRPDDRQ